MLGEQARCDVLGEVNEVRVPEHPVIVDLAPIGVLAHAAPFVDDRRIQVHAFRDGVLDHLIEAFPAPGHERGPGQVIALLKRL